jgi:hypothetical protein
MAPDNTPHEEKIETCLRYLERLLVKLFGEVEGEHPTGRLPTLEATTHSHGERLTALETWKTKWMSVICFILAIGTFADILVRLIEAIKH